MMKPDPPARCSCSSSGACCGMRRRVVGPDGVRISGVCAFDFRIRPRSALMITPNATDAMMIAIVDRMRLVDEFMTSSGSFALLIIGGKKRLTEAALHFRRTTLGNVSLNENRPRHDVPSRLQQKSPARAGLGITFLGKFVRRPGAGRRSGDR